MRGGLGILIGVAALAGVGIYVVKARKPPTDPAAGVPEPLHTMYWGARSNPGTLSRDQLSDLARQLDLAGFPKLATEVREMPARGDLPPPPPTAREVMRVSEQLRRQRAGRSP